MQDPDTKDAVAEKKTEGASGSEAVKPNTTDSSKPTPDKTETSASKPEKPTPEKTTDSKTTKHDSGLNPVKSDSAKDGKEARDTKEDSAKERPSKKSSSHTRSTKLPSCSLPVNMQPTFYVGGGNGVSLVEAPLLGLGWKRTSDKYDERFRLKWVECKTRINYGAFKEGEQLVNHIPNGNLLTNKLGLLNSLQEYERVTMSTKGRPPRLRFTDFVPETYRFDEKHDREAFMDCYKDNELWICKPTGMNQGKGIFIIRSREELDKLIEEREQRREQLAKSSKPMMTRIVQKYITNPLLLDERKFDIRAYMLIASTTPYLVLYHKGYVRLCCNKYKEDSKELSTHLTNQFVQKKDPNYKDVKEDTAWSMDKFNQYINENVAPHKEMEQDWVYNTLTKQMQKIMIHCFNSVKHKLQSRVGFFDLFGLDFMVDTDLKVYLIEINVNPALHTNCEALKEVIPGVVEETLYVTIECFEKTRKNQQLLPLNSMKNFSILYCGSRPYNMPSRPSRSVSPSKDTSNQEKRGSIPNTAAPGAPRSLHRFSTTSTPVVSAPPVSSVSKSTQEKPPAEKVSTEKPSEKSSVEKKQPAVVDVHRVPNPNAKLSDMVSFSSSTLLAEAGNLLGQTTNVLDETVKLKMVHGDEKQPGEDEKLKKEDSNVKEKANSAEKSSEGVVLNLAPPEKQPSAMVEKSNKTSTADAQPVTSNIKTTSSTTSTANTKPKPFVGRVTANTSTTSSPVATSSLSSTTKSSPGEFNSSATTSKPGLTEITPKPAYPYVIATSTTSTNDITSKNVSNFPLITNNGNSSKSARHSSLSQSLRPSRDTSGKASSSGGLSSNPYSLSNSLGKPHGSAVYLNTATTRSLNVTGSNALSTANSHSNSAKIMTVPSITISEPGPKTIATLTLTSSRAGFLGRSDVRSGVRRSRDRDKPDRGN